MPTSPACANPHRALYRLEYGVWWARCRVCDWAVSDADRRRAAAVYRQHLTDMATKDSVAEVRDGKAETNDGEINLRTADVEAEVEALQFAY